jgi:MoxR-like ATPase
LTTGKIPGAADAGVGVPTPLPLETARGVDNDLAAVEQLRAACARLREQLGQVIVGQDQVIEQLLIALFSRGHCLLVGVPGLAKTLLVSTVARILSLDFKRIQFTPDLMPADITGTEIIQEDPVTRERKFRFLRGPLFAHIILADEINRTPPKTQAALLEAMQEHRVTAGGQTYTLDEPFFVLATQNPIEQEGTYPLPEAQLDRFMFMVMVEYPTLEEELAIMRKTTAPDDVSLAPCLDAAEILGLQEIVRRVPVADHVFQYAIRLARATRAKTPEAPPFVNEWVQWGAGPRASQYLILGGKARAVLSGRTYATCEDVAAIARPVLRHRIITNFNAEAQGINADSVIQRLIETIPIPTKK